MQLFIIVKCLFSAGFKEAYFYGKGGEEGRAREGRGRRKGKGGEGRGK